MKITGVKDLHCNFGWRNLSFLKIETDEGLTGWTEYYEGAGNAGVTAVIRALSAGLTGRDPRQVDRIITELSARTIQAVGGINQHAIGAIGNALLDVKAKALGVPVHALFGGAIRDRLPLYWSHCVSYRARYPKDLGVEPPKSYDDIAAIGAEARRKGFRSLKTNTVLMVDGKFVGYRPTAGESHGYPELNLSREFLNATVRQLDALREGSGPEMEISLDVNFYFKPEGFLVLARALERFGLQWLEIDNFDPRALAQVRAGSRVPIASLEHSYGRRGYKPFLDQNAVDVAIVDPIWNGYREAIRIADLADAYEVNVAPHNYYGYLSDFITANLAAVIPNLRIMETDIDSVRWRPELYTHAPEILAGDMIVPQRPGWGTEPIESVIAKFLPK